MSVNISVCYSKIILCRHFAGASLIYKKKIKEQEVRQNIFAVLVSRVILWQPCLMTSWKVAIMRGDILAVLTVPGVKVSRVYCVTLFR